MFSHHLGRALAIASTVLLSACKTFSPDGGMSTVAAVAGERAKQERGADRLGRGRRAGARRSRAPAAAPLSADGAVQIALLNNLGAASRL